MKDLLAVVVLAVFFAGFAVFVGRRGRRRGGCGSCDGGAAPGCGGCPDEQADDGATP